MNNCKYCGIECKRIFCSLSCKSKHWAPILKDRPKKVPIRKSIERIDFEQLCERCGKLFVLKLRPREIANKEYRRNCSRSCANVRVFTDEIISKIRESSYKKSPEERAIEAECKKQTRLDKLLKQNRVGELITCMCGKAFAKKGNATTKFCSPRCASDHLQQLTDLRIETSLENTGSFPKMGSDRMKKYLIKKQGHVCSICKETIWMGKPIPLIMDHINGRASDNAYSNLRLVCGNCDMQLPTYKSKNKNSDRRNRKKWSFPNDIVQQYRNYLETI